MSKLHLLDRQRPYIMAHRSNRVQFPENTLSAFQQAVSDGADIIETDLRTSSDGAFHCIRDTTLDRTTNGTGTVSELQYEEVRPNNAAATQPDLPSEPVPTIRELAKATSFLIMIALELKSDAFLEPETCQHLSKEIRREELHERIVFLSFSSPHLHTVCSVDLDLPIGWITSNCSWPQPGMEMLGQYWPLLILNPMLSLITHLMGQLVCPLDPTPDTRLPQYHLLGCDAVLSDNPGKTAYTLGRSSHKGFAK